MGDSLPDIQPTIVIVDDDPDVLGSLQFVLETDGYQVSAHASGQVLLDGDALPDRGCLVLDYQMPGMDGLTLLRRLRERGARLPALLITTPSVALRREAALAGVPIVEKPLQPGYLQSKLRDMLDNPGALALA